ncbi:MAG: ROK family protein [Candidatus Nanopelagicales bacterium]|nr:ROK family protein [Candidatus Nanopelagicales bacterium]
MMRAGVDLGGTKIQVVIVDPKNAVLGSDRRPTPTVGGPDDVTDTIADSIRAAVGDAQIEMSDLLGIGVGAPGQIDLSAGTLSNAGNLPGWMLTYPLAGQLSKRMGGVPVALGNDVQVGVNAEVHLGAGRSFNSLLGVFCGTGVGGGVVIDREMWVGRGAAGEIGHVCIMAKGGAPCTCGRSGCMEAYAGRAAMEIQARKWKSKGKKTVLFKIMKKKDRVRLSSGVWYRAIKQKDKMAIKLMDRAIWALGAGVGSSVNLLDVDAVIIGGGLGIRMGKPFVRDIEKAMMPHLIKSKNPPKVLLAELGDLGGALGAALLVEKLVKVPAIKTTRAPAAAARSRQARTAAQNAAASLGTKAPAKRSTTRRTPAAKRVAAADAAKAPAKPPAKAGAKTTVARKAPAKKAPVKRPAAKKAPVKKAPTS